MSAAFEPRLVTVVVASYNHAEYLVRRMDSLLAQTYPHIEILVIDDCSPDDSVQVLQAYERHPNVRLLSNEKNSGWVATSNRGAQLARGEYLLFGNCDDACDPRMIERLVGAMEAHRTAGIAFCRSLFIDEHDRVIGDDFATREPAFRRACKMDTLIPAARMGRFLLDSCAIPNLSAALFRRDVFIGAGMLSPAFRVCSDWDLFFRIAAKHDVAYVAEPLNLFRQHETTIRTVTKERVIDDEILSLLLRQIRELDLSFVERCRYRTHAMYLWAVHIIAPSWSGLRNFPYLAGRVFRLDPPALLFLLPGLAKRAVGICGKVLSRLHLIPDTPR